MKKMVGRRVLGFAMASVMAMGMGTAAMAEETTYPMDTDATFVYWGELNSSVSANFNSLADTEIGKDWQEKTGVTIEFQHPVIIRICGIETGQTAVLIRVDQRRLSLMVLSSI